jgi:hypothetical protein
MKQEPHTNPEYDTLDFLLCRTNLAWIAQPHLPTLAPLLTLKSPKWWTSKRVHALIRKKDFSLNRHLLMVPSA